MKHTQDKQQRRTLRHRRLRATVQGTAERPRLAVFRSNRFVYVQLINDITGTTLAAVDSRKVGSGTMSERAVAVGTEIAKRAQAAGVTKVVFDRGGFQYQGIVAAVADAARAGGLEF
jgi:large subunit ribosomal protein L18